MKLNIKLIACLFVIFTNQAISYSQVTADTILCGNDTVYISLDNYQFGTISWQESTDGYNWLNIENENSKVFKRYITDQKYYRALIVISSCEEIYSGIALVKQIPKAKAGIDQTVSGNKTKLNGNRMQGANGNWAIISVTGASLSDNSSPDALFEGLGGNKYILTWALTNECGTTTDTVTINFIQNQYNPNYIIVDSTDIILSDSIQLDEGKYHIQFSEIISGINDSCLLLGIEGKGFLRKVTGFNKENDSTFLFETEQAWLDDLCINGIFNLGAISAQLSGNKKNTSEIKELKRLPTRKELLTNKDFRNNLYVYNSAPKLSLLAPEIKAKKSDNPDAIILNMNYLNLSWALDKPGENSFSTQMWLNGTYSLTPNYFFDISIKDNTLNYLKIDLDNAILENNLNIELVNSINGTISEDESSFLQTSLTKNSVEKLLIIDGMPVLVTTETELLLQAYLSGTGNSNITISDKTNTSFSAGMFNSDGVTTNYENSEKPGIIEPVASVEGEMKVHFALVPSIKSEIYGIPGPYAFISSVSEIALCGQKSNPEEINQWNAQLSTSLKTEMGSNVKLSETLTEPVVAFFQIGETNTQSWPYTMEILSGNNQSANPGSQLPQAFKVRVSCSTGAAVPLVPVFFEVSMGNGSLEYTMVLTNQQGIAETYFTLDNTEPDNEVMAMVMNCLGNEIEDSPLYFQAKSNTSGNSDLCENSSLSIGIKLNDDNTIEPFGILGVAPYNYSTDGLNFTIDAPKLAAVPFAEILFFVKDANGCVISKTFIVPDPCLNTTLLPVVTISGNTATLSATGGLPPYTYSLDKTLGFSANEVYPDLPDENYTAWVKDSKGCIQSATFAIGGNAFSESSLPTIITNYPTTITWYSASLSGSISVQGSNQIIESGFCWSLSPLPTINDNKQSLGNTIGNINFNLTGLNSGSYYYMRVFAVTGMGISYGNTIEFYISNNPNNPIIFNPNLSYGTISDIDGNTYKTIQIGTQTWMAENLKTTKYNDGSDISLITDNIAWQTARAAYCWYNNDAANYKATYGALYNWYAVDANSNQGKNICPSGWGVPTDAEWTTLTTYIGGEPVASAKMKESGYTHWVNNNYVADNSTGFTAIPAGYRNLQGCFYGDAQYSFWWGSDGQGSNPQYSMFMFDNNVIHYFESKNHWIFSTLY